MKLFNPLSLALSTANWISFEEKPDMVKPPLFNKLRKEINHFPFNVFLSLFVLYAVRLARGGTTACFSIIMFYCLSHVVYANHRNKVKVQRKDSCEYGYKDTRISAFYSSYRDTRTSKRYLDR